LFLSGLIDCLRVAVVAVAVVAVVGLNSVILQSIFNGMHKYKNNIP
jgi:hypothetical protein